MCGLWLAQSTISRFLDGKRTSILEDLCECSKLAILLETQALVTGSGARGLSVSKKLRSFRGDMMILDHNKLSESSENCAACI